ncbi:MAG: hypothetical protein HY247_02300 [archaeon]|nr:MAG: hypothetical protein HY247_02300 [archaeon]
MPLKVGGFRLELLPLESLHPHEEIIQRHADALAVEMRKEGVQRDPMLIDTKSKVVLDGMHRLAALPMIGAKMAVCCLVDYSSESVNLSRWARVYGASDDASLTEAAGVLGATRECSASEAFEAVESKTAALAVVLGSRGIVSGRRTNLQDSFSKVRALDQVAESRGWGRGFVPEEEAMGDEEGGAMFVLLQRLDKKNVLDAGRAGALFPCKTSLHSVDPRPVAIRFPISRLGQGKAKLDAKALGKGRVVGGGTEYMGRRYKERLLFLDGS